MKNLLILFFVIISQYATAQIIDPYQWNGWKNVRDGLPDITIKNGTQVDETPAFFTSAPISYDKNDELIRPFAHERKPLSVFFIEGGAITNKSVRISSGPTSDEVWENMFITSLPVIELKTPTGSRSYIYQKPEQLGTIIRVVWVKNWEIKGYEYKLVL